MLTTERLVGKGFGEDAAELQSEGLAIEIAYVHDGSVVFLREPFPSFPHFGTPDVPTVSAWDFSSRAIVLPEAVFEERLRDLCGEETPVGADGKGGDGAEQCPSVDDAEERDLLLPNLHHRVVERGDVLPSGFECLVFREVRGLFHEAKVASTPCHGKDRRNKKKEEAPCRHRSPPDSVFVAYAVTQKECRSKCATWHRWGPIGRRDFIEPVLHKKTGSASFDCLPVSQIDKY